VQPSGVASEAAFGDPEPRYAPAAMVTPAAPAPETTSFEPVARLDELTDDGPHARSVGGVDVVVVRSGGALRVFDGRCPHQGALLGEGELDGGALVCRNHRWTFDATSGKRRGGPECLRACPSREEAGVLLADVSALRQGEAAAPPNAARALDELPRPRGLPLFGNALSIDIERMHDQLEAWAAELGAPYALKLGPRWTVVFDDPAVFEVALRARPERFRRPSQLEQIFIELSTHGVFSAEGPAWRPQRRLAMEALSHRNLRGFYPTLALVAERLRRRWEAAAADGRPVDVQDDFMRFTVDVTTSLAFGYDMNTLETDDDALQQTLEPLLPKTMQRIMAIVPYWRFVRLPSDRRVDRSIAELRGFFQGLIGKARARLATAGGDGAGAPANFLDAMLAARDEHGEPFSDEELIGNALTMLLAGEDTTANSLAWAIHLLIDAPDEVAALRRELDAAGIRGVPADLERVGKLTYAGAITSETMRLRPVAPLIFLEALNDEVLGGVAIPRGVQFCLLTRAPGRRADNFVAPTEFRPARWIAPTGAHDPAVNLPFGSGPRICPGRSLALVEMKVVLATMLSCFDLERVGAAGDVREVFNFTMRPEGLKVRVRPRAA
jgi:cytochrome P450/nitrite reductase/ring-hydroxylating ferredoxin subunit